jgi:hypothetical protein
MIQPGILVIREHDGISFDRTPVRVLSLGRKL